MPVNLHKVCELSKWGNTRFLICSRTGFLEEVFRIRNSLFVLVGRKERCGNGYFACACLCDLFWDLQYNVCVVCTVGTTALKH